MHCTRRDVIKYGSMFCLSAMLGCNKAVGRPMTAKAREFEIFPVSYTPYPLYFSAEKPVVSIVKVNERWSAAKGVEYAVAQALDLIGGVNQLTRGKERILIKPNLVSPAPTDTTKPPVVEALAVLMQKAGKNVCIGEAGAASMQNIKSDIMGAVCRTSDDEKLRLIQDDIFKQLGYSDLSKKIDVPLVNLHVGKMAKMAIPDNFVYQEIHLHEALYNTDMVCSVPMMKTHGLAGVTLALKNVGIGAYPGLVYGTVRSEVHRKASDVEPTGTSSAIIDMVKANKIGLSVIDATMAMQGQGPSKMAGGKILKMNLIIAGSSALAVDMVGAHVMGFETSEIDTFTWASKAGMRPRGLDEIQIVGEKAADVRRIFKKPLIAPYTAMKDWYGPPC